MEAQKPVTWVACEGRDMSLEHFMTWSLLLKCQLNKSLLLALSLPNISPLNCLNFSP